MVLKWLKNIGKNTVYYPGCLTSYILQDEASNYRKILEKLKVDFIVLPEHLCCGSPVLNAGYEKDARNLARKNLELFKKYNVRKIITNCPACFKTFLQDYKELLPEWDIEVEHVITTILNHLRKKKMDSENREKVTYHDPCHLGRHLGILRNQKISDGPKNSSFCGYDEPREILERLGFEIIEMKHNRENSLCCGGGAGLRVNSPELADKIAKARILEAKELGVSKIITPCPLCFAHLGENSDIEIVEFSHVVAEGLGLKAEKTNIKKEKCELKEACS